MKTLHLAFKKNIHISFVLAMVFMLLATTKTPAVIASSDAVSINNVVTFTKLDLYANIETMGIAVSGVNLPKTAQLMYRKNGDTTWCSGHYLVLMMDVFSVVCLGFLRPRHMI
jgi:hypothetical protein